MNPLHNIPMGQRGLADPGYSAEAMYLNAIKQNPGTRVREIHAPCEDGSVWEFQYAFAAQLKK